jgi:hypothetical protein
MAAGFLYGRGHVICMSFQLSHEGVEREEEQTGTIKVTQKNDITDIKCLE